MVKQGWKLQGNDRYEGFCIDLLKRIAARVGFSYTIELVPDNMYGVLDTETNQWNGIVKELIDKVIVFTHYNCSYYKGFSIYVLCFCVIYRKLI